MACENYWETAKAFQLQDSIVLKICKTSPPDKSETHQGFKGGKAWKRNGEGAGHLLSYPASLDEELLSWLVIMNNFHLPVSILALQKKKKSIILPHSPCFEDSRGWVRQFKERHNLALQKNPSLYQKLPSQLESKISPFYSECSRFLKVFTSRDR